MRAALALLFVCTGLLHLVAPQIYLGIMPPSLAHPIFLIYLSGVAEVAGGIGLLIERVRPAAGIGLIVLLLAVFPANVQMLINRRDRNSPAWMKGVLVARLPLQLLLMLAAWKVSRPAVVARKSEA